MKKLSVLLIMFLLGFGANADAVPLLPLWEATPAGFTIEDRQGGWDPDDPDASAAAGYSADYVGYTGDDWSGYYLGTITEPANDDPGSLSDLVNYYLGTSYELGYYKVDVPDDWTEGTPDSGTAGPLTMAWDEDGKNGTWSTDPAVALPFYTVKGANEFALYYLDPSADSGIWTTAHLLTPNGRNQPEISHLSVFTPVPEPATMLLFGTGLIGLAGVGRKKFFKNNK